MIRLGGGVGGGGVGGGGWNTSEAIATINIIYMRNLTKSQENKIEIRNPTKSKENKIEITKPNKIQGKQNWNKKT